MKPTILIVEDDIEAQTIASYALKSENLKIRFANHFSEAKEILENEVIELVVLDYCLPGPDGAEICQSIKGNPVSNTIPVIMWSIDGYSLTRSKCFKAGADSFIEKPARMGEFLQEIRKFLQPENLQVAAA